MATTTESLSASYVAVRFGVTEKTARLFMHKVRETMKSSENHPMDGNVHVDEFVVGVKKKVRLAEATMLRKRKWYEPCSLPMKGKLNVCTP